MVVVELRWFLFGLLTVISVVVVLITWADHRRFHRSVASTFTDPQIRTVMEHIPFGWLVAEDAKRYVYANAYARELLRLVAPAGQIPSEEWGFLLANDQSNQRQNRLPEGQYRVLRLPSNRVARWWLVSGQRWDYLFLLDITAQYEAEGARTNLFSNLSHELRTPIGTILTHLEILALPDVSQQLKQQSLRLLKTETKRMARMVNLMLELGRLETSPEMERRPVDLVPVAEHVILAINARSKGRGISFSLESDTPLPPVWGDKDRLMQVFFNLLDNVLTHCRPGDHATITLRRSEKGVLCTVEDTGPGIPSEHLPFLTRHFYRAARQETEGSGLGLALVEEILRRHGSHLEITSRTEGETGTCVQFTLPTLPTDSRS